jgi:penicillin amidase
MKLSPRQILGRLGTGEPIDSVCQAAGLSRAEFDAWWRREAAARVPPTDGSRRAPVGAAVEIHRDRWGLPHILAASDEDLFVGFGYAMAQDRLFQLDYLRRKGAGRLAEVLGAEALEYDLLVRTVGLPRIAEVEWTLLPEENRRLLTAFTAGINALIEESVDRPPLEFDLLDYRPEPWTPLDCLVIENEFRWYLTGRFPVIVMPELAKRVLGEGPLYQAFLHRESDEESVIPPGSYPAGRVGSQPVGRSAGDPDGAQGSNNWVVSGNRATGGLPLVASDPHIAMEAVSCWYEAHLCGGSFNVAGMAYAGIPAIMFGRNQRVAWGCTNNICSQRDLYQERTDGAHPGCYQYDGRWLPERRLEETIAVRGRGAATHAIRFSHNGPIVDDVLPPPARGTGPVSLKWLGAYRGGWHTALLGMNRAEDAASLRQAMEPWHVPTFAVVYADVEGHIGFQTTGRIPIRNTWERGYRPGWDPAHQWDGLVPFDGLPRLVDPPRGWIATANARPAPDDFPYPLSGTWSDDNRSVRIRQMIEGRDRMTREDIGAMHQDSLSLRAQRSAPALVAALRQAGAGTELNSIETDAIGRLAEWDFLLETDRVAATIFEVFFTRWTTAVAAARFEGETAALLSMGVSGLAAQLLSEDPAGWFGEGAKANGGAEGQAANDRARLRAIRDTFRGTLDWLANRLGPSIADWTWGRLHTIPLRHVLSTRGELAALLDHGGPPVRGGLTTVCNTSPGPDWAAKIGAGYRLIADLAQQPPALWAIDVGSQSGHPGSPHYRDQLDDWISGRYHDIPLDPSQAQSVGVTRQVLRP